MPIDKSGIGQIVDIHLRAFPESTLSLFGRKVLTKWYQWHFSPPNQCHAFGAFEGDVLRGFCLSGVFRNSEVFFFQEHFFYVLWQLIVHPQLILNNKTIERFMGITTALKDHLKSKSKEKQKIRKSRSNRFGILSIAVDPNSQGHGIGSLLVNEVELLALEIGVFEIRLSVDPTNFQAVSFYQKHGWQRICFESDEPWQGYMKKVLQ